MPPDNLRIALVAPPFVVVPPPRYGGIERVVAALGNELHERGHSVTLFACDGSTGPFRVVATTPRPAWELGWDDRRALDVVAGAVASDDRRGRFDVVHSHLGAAAIAALRANLGNDRRLVHTIHLPVDRTGMRRSLERPPGALVAISTAQAAQAPELRWAAVVPNGLRFEPSPRVPRGDDLCFVGRIDPDKGVLDAIDVARLAGRRLRIAARAGTLPRERDYYERVFRPALARADVEYLGEVTAGDRDALFASSYATLVTPRWPEPFGLVTIESLAHGTPVLAFRAGALPELLRDGVDGFLGGSVAELAARMAAVATLDRDAIARAARERFSAARMTDGYEAVYRRVASGSAAAGWDGAPTIASRRRVTAGGVAGPRRAQSGGRARLPGRRPG